MQITTLRQFMHPKDRDRDRVSDMEQPGGDVIEIKSSTSNTADDAATKDRVK
ncbi:MAG TPA: hypothetical protein VK436_13590 [Methanocella sp.]|nr:hypothetical protein [Methanocella sp.]